ncbi:O-glucosyltransferase rumi homolog [Solanum tuberosum]|nr:PREDICTED: O-glucosyltransferase rumi homolog [Solanum tuberosum]
MKEILLNSFWNKSNNIISIVGAKWKYLKRVATTTYVTLLLFLFLTITVSALSYVGWIDLAKYSVHVKKKAESMVPSLVFIEPDKKVENQPMRPQILEYPLDCNAWNKTNTCPTTYPKSYKPLNPNNSTCPEYFRWIHEDLRHWKNTGITREMLEKSKKYAHFRLIILDGRIYIERYAKYSIETRHLFTMYGIVQLLRFYPGKLPNLEIMFDTDDRPVIPEREFRRPDSGPPPLFRYCSDWQSLDIVFPDWSFWGWGETNIRPWRSMLKNIKEGNKRSQWKDRIPLAYWRGNPLVSHVRKDLIKCNVTDKQNWDTLLYPQDWKNQSKIGYKESNIEDQCTHRYKIYVEGWAWSVSEKYIFACDSPTLYIESHFYDFFIRGMIPQQHYWPISDNDKCKSLKFAVQWGNNHTHKAEAIGKAGSEFIHEDMKMERVFDYIYHLLNEYAKLQRFDPIVPQDATEICSESLACPVDGLWRKFMEEGLEKSPSYSDPCILPPPYDPQQLKTFVEQKVNATKQVRSWESEYWSSLNKKQ